MPTRRSSDLGNQSVCAIRDPAQVYQADGLQFVLNAEVRFALTTGSGVTSAKAEYYGVGEKVERRGPAAMAAADKEDDDDAPIIRQIGRAHV